MTPLCSTCHGDCCVNKRGSVVEHGSALALHSCPDCLDGFAPANPVCPTCGGLCCRITASVHTRVSHRSVTHTTHECDCLDGTASAPDLAAERLAALLDAERENTALRAEVERLRSINDDYLLEMGRQHALLRDQKRGENAERAAVVAYLRGLADDYGVCIDLSLIEQADKIERGEHRRKEKE